MHQLISIDCTCMIVSVHSWQRYKYDVPKNSLENLLIHRLHPIRLDFAFPCSHLFGTRFLGHVLERSRFAQKPPRPAVALLGPCTCVAPGRQSWSSIPWTREPSSSCRLNHRVVSPDRCGCFYCLCIVFTPHASERSRNKAVRTM